MEACNSGGKDEVTEAGFSSCAALPRLFQGLIDVNDRPIVRLREVGGSGMISTNIFTHVESSLALRGLTGSGDKLKAPGILHQIW